MPVRAFLFDFDGLILDTELASRAGWQLLYREHGHELPADLWATLVGTTHAPWSPMDAPRGARRRAARPGRAERAPLRARDRAHRGGGAAARDRRLSRRRAPARPEARDRVELDRAAGSTCTWSGSRRRSAGTRSAPPTATRRARSRRRRSTSRRSTLLERRRGRGGRVRGLAERRPAPRRRRASSASPSRTRSRASSGSTRPEPTSSSTRSPTSRPTSLFRRLADGVGSAPWLHTRSPHRRDRVERSSRTGSRSATTSASRPSA